MTGSFSPLLGIDRTMGDSGFAAIDSPPIAATAADAPQSVRNERRSSDRDSSIGWRFSLEDKSAGKFVSLSGMTMFEGTCSGPVLCERRGEAERRQS